MAAELNLLGWIGHMSLRARSVADRMCLIADSTHPAVTAASVARHLGQARPFRIKAGEFSTGGGGETS